MCVTYITTYENDPFFENIKEVCMEKLYVCMVKKYIFLQMPYKNSQCILTFFSKEKEKTSDEVLSRRNKNRVFEIYVST